MVTENIKNEHYYKYGEKTIKKLNFDLWNNIVSHVDLNISFKEKFYLYENKIDMVPICECGSGVKFIDMVKGFRKFCSKRCLANSNETKQKKNKTNLERFGVLNPSQNWEVREKVKKTNLNKFGVEYPLKSKEILEKTKKVNLEKWGVENPSQIRSVREKAENTNLEKFGVRHASQNNLIKENIKQHFIEKWGVENPSKVNDVRKKAEETNLEKFGFKHALQSEEFKNKSKETNLKKYGKEFYTQTEEYIKKVKETNLKKYGVDSYSKTIEYREKVANTSMEKWGVLNYSQTEECKEKIIESNKNKYGTEFISQSDVYRKDNFRIAKDPFYVSYISDGVSLFNCDCLKSHNFEINIDNYIQRKSLKTSLCTVCYPIGDSKSIKEKEVYDYIKSIYSGKIIQSYRDGLEIDIYVPEFKIGFEFNGLYWHSEIFKDKNYHLEKTNHFMKKDIRIIHIWEDDWTLKKNIVKSQIRNFIGLTSNKIFARKCQVKEVFNSNKFLDENHVQGSVNSVIKIGLFYNGELVSLMTFDHFEGRKKMSQDQWNLNRFCNKLDTNVIGGASKLLSYFMNYTSAKD